ncbi:hypothetical protein [Stenotrophomonas rhizophila]|nr:hypothetical protein [Stenotrophomonas rhizophila]
MLGKLLPAHPDLNIEVIDEVLAKIRLSGERLPEAALKMTGR